MNKKLALITCLLLATSTTNAGLLDKVNKATADVQAAKETGASAKKTAESSKDNNALTTAAIKSRLGENATKPQVEKLFGKPSTPAFKNAKGEEVLQYSASSINKGLGNAAAVAGSLGVAQDLSQLVEFTFKDNVVTGYAVVDAGKAK